MQPRTQPVLYRYLENLPEVLIGKILDGQVHAQPSPSIPHMVASSALDGELFGPFRKGNGGTSDWWILSEPEIHFKHNLKGECTGSRRLAT